ncbi:MAG: hypothetical protein KatS3mg061_1573 [Dehalococcoidia bacterium]|nr:MAG: hypothetical protein KatS3mg061_1573 [Dehalococcoidia bacterium]
MARWRFVTRCLLRTIPSLVAVAAVLLSNAPRGSEAAQDDWALPGGWFYTQTRGEAPAGNGFAVLDTANIPFYRAFRQLGGVEALGYPVTQRFVLDDGVAQAFQRGVLSWRPETGVQLLSVTDTLGQAGLNDWLAATYAIPAPGAPNPALLAANEAIAAAYATVRNGASVFGQPVALDDFGPVVTLRTERLALQQWKVETRFAPAGAVVVPNAGDMLSAAGLVPVGAARPAPAAELLSGVGGVYPYAGVTAPQPYYYLPYYPYYVPPTVQSQPYYPAVYSWLWYYPGVYAVPQPMVYPYFIYGLYAPYTYTPFAPGVTYYYPAPVFTPLPQALACQGDEQMTFDPGRPGVNQLFTISVTSARPSVNVSLQGPGNPRFVGVSLGGKGYIWRWQAQIGSSGTYNFNFLVGGTVCTANVVTVG